MEKKDDRERELDSFLERAQESRGKRAGFDDWDNTPKKRNAPSGNYWNAILVAGVLVVIAVLYFAAKEVKNLKGVGGVDKIIERNSSASNNGSDSLKLDQGKYQAIFLTNGQVYFGKINSHDESYVEVTDIYYLQVKPVLQQGDNGNNNDNKNQQQQQTELSLVKLGSELHGPMDRMSINKDQIVFVEDLKDDSKVTEAIRNYQNGSNK